MKRKSLKRSFYMFARELDFFYCFPQVYIVRGVTIAFSKSKLLQPDHSWINLRTNPRRCINMPSLRTDIQLYMKHETHLFHIVVYISARSCDTNDENSMYPRLSAIIPDKRVC